MTPRLLERYRNEIAPKLREEFSFGNLHQVPRMTKIVVNMGLGEAAANPGERARSHHWAEGVDPEGAQIRRQLQAPRGPGDRLLRDPSQCAYVGVLRSFDECVIAQSA